MRARHSRIEQEAGVVEVGGGLVDPDGVGAEAVDLGEGWRVAGLMVPALWGVVAAGGV